MTPNIIKIVLLITHGRKNKYVKDLKVINETLEERKITIKEEKDPCCLKENRE